MKIRNRVVRQIAAVVFVWAIRILFYTLRLDFRIRAPHTNPYHISAPQRFIYCVWHDSALIPSFGGKSAHLAALTSRHHDGSFVATVLEGVGICPVRGSTNRGGAVAVRKLMTTAVDRHVVMTPDGPRGPRRKISPGIVYLASRSGRAIVPASFSCSRSWSIKGSWTDLVIPKPFAHVVLRAGEPILVPHDLARGELEEFAMQVQMAMDRLHERD